MYDISPKKAKDRIACIHAMAGITYEEAARPLDSY